jgi:hypothetical protein
MQRNDSLYPPDWLAITEKDSLRIEWSLRENDPEIAGFLLQQSVEKFLKAFLLSNSWPLRRIHTLSVLLDDAIQYEPSLEQYRLACQRIALYLYGFALSFRAPDRCDGSGCTLLARPNWRADRAYSCSTEDVKSIHAIR